ncbi:MAG: S8 family serine peptidase, partial [Flavitalea sp.]
MYLKLLLFWILSFFFDSGVHSQNRKPVVESHLEGFIPSVNQLNLLHARFPHLNGSGITISIKEQKVDSGDIDFKGRFKTSLLASDFITTHASQMATLAAGGGNSSDYSKGAAWKAWISSSSFLNLLPDAEEYFDSGEISVQNHSYGTGIESYYGGDAAAYDSQVIRKPHLLHIFSAGNLGDQQNTSGKYAGLNFGNISGSFKMAKNSLSIGAVDGFLSVATRSSRGPAHDGRIKPELVAYGIDGSSGAAAITSGISAVLQQQYFDKYRVLPPSSLVRGILMNTAKDIEDPGPDFFSGYGNVQAVNAISVIEKENFILSGINPNEEKIFELSVPGNLSEIRVMLSWTDPSSTPDTSKALINDLDLSLEDPSGNLIHPWVLSHFPNADSLSKPAFRGIDTLNNQEQVTITSPKEGVYKIIIRASLTSSFQNFAVNWYWEKDSLHWGFPVRGDKMEKGKEVILRWNQPLQNNGNLEIRNSNGWESVGAVRAGSTLFAYTPSQTGAYQLRLSQGNQYLVTDSFTVSEQP